MKNKTVKNEIATKQVLASEVGTIIHDLLSKLFTEQLRSRKYWSAKECKTFLLKQISNYKNKYSETAYRVAIRVVSSSTHYFLNMTIANRNIFKQGVPGHDATTSFHGAIRYVDFKTC